MAIHIAVAGKGGTGKTTVASLIVRYLLRSGRGTVLAVDADPNANFGESLGLKVQKTIGQVLHEFQGEKLRIPPGMTKEAYLEYQLNTAVTEGRNLDLITMGRGEGPECYCYPNTVIRRLIDSWSKNYDYVVIDNEAGMEHLSRRTTQNIDEMLIVSDYTIKGLRAAARIIELIRELALTVRRQSVLINTAPVQLELLFREEMERLGIVPAAIIPQDMTLARYDLEQKPLLELPDDSAAVMAMNTLLERLLNRPAAVIK